MASAHPDAVVVGGGVIGCAIAYALAGDGARVTLVERAEVAAESSGAAAGILAPRVHATADAMLPLALASQELFEPLVAELLEVTGLGVEYARSPVLDLADDADAATALQEKVRWLRAAGHDVTWMSTEEVLRARREISPPIVTRA